MALFDTPDAAGQALPTLTPDSIKRRRLMAELMLKQGSDYSPVLSPWQGAARMANALMGGLIEGQTDQMERQGQIEGNQAMVKALQSIYGGDSTGATASTAPAAPAAPAIGSGAAPGGPLPSDRVKVASDYLTSQGYQPHQVAGIVGNLMAESGLNPTALAPRDGRDGSNSIGVAQWNGPRAQAFQQFAAANKMDPNDLKTQMAFVHQELQTTEKPTLAALQAAKTPAEAASAFVGFERPAGWRSGDPTGAMAYDKRLGYANRVASVLGGASPAQASAGSPVQVASADPGFVPGPQPTGLMAAGAPVPLPPNRPPEFGPSAQTPPDAASAAPAAATAAAPDVHPAVAQQVVTAASSPQVQQAAAQAAATPAGKQVMAQAQNMPLAALMTAMSNPWISDGQKSLLLMAAKEKLGNQYGFTVAGDTMYRTNSRTGEVTPIQSVSKPTTLGADQRLVDPTTGKVIVGPAGGYRPMTPDEKKAAGIDASYPAFMGPDGKPIFGNPGMNINNQSESEESKVVGKAVGERRVKVENAYSTVPDKLNKIQLFKTLLDGVKTGALAGGQSKVADLALGLGIPPEALKTVGIDPNLPATEQALQSAIASATVGMIGQGGFPANNFSDADRKFLMGTNVSLQNRPEGNSIILEVQKRTAQRELEAADDWNRYKDAEAAAGRTPSFTAWEQQWSRKVNSGPSLFSDLKPQAEAITQSGPKGPIDMARDAIKRGAPRDAVIKRLRDNGIDPSGL